MPRKDDEEPREPAPRPEPYPLDSALESAYGSGWSIPHVGHTDDDEYRVGAASKAPWETGQRAEMTGEDAGGKVQTLVAAGDAAIDQANGEEPQTFVQWLAPLPKWQGFYVLQLMDLGGVPALACRACNVSHTSVKAAQKASPAFRDACAAAAEFAHGLTKASLYRAGTMGELQPVFQGGKCVGYKRLINVKAAEISLRMAGEYQPDNSAETARGAAIAAQVTLEAMPAAVAGVLEKLYAANRGRPRPETIEAEVVAEAR